MKIWSTERIAGQKIFERELFAFEKTAEIISKEFCAFSY
jgi:hypothetical protein